MKTTRDNLNGVLFEDQDVRFSIADVAAHTSTNLYYYHDVEIVAQKALDIWCKVRTADEEEDGFYSVSFLDLSKERIPLPPGLRQAFSQWYFQRGYLKGLASGGTYRIW